VEDLNNEEEEWKLYKEGMELIRQKHKLDKKKPSAKKKRRSAAVASEDDDDDDEEEWPDVTVDFRMPAKRARAAGEGEEEDE